jgi:tripartite-type tricarboxylate transporter receptor subunit TctC
MGKWLSERLGQEFVIENRSGATMNIATDVAVRAPSDGYRARWHRHLNGRIP